MCGNIWENCTCGHLTHPEEASGAPHAHEGKDHDHPHSHGGETHSHPHTHGEGHDHPHAHPEHKAGPDTVSRR